jgi:hypothetical protein
MAINSTYTMPEVQFIGGSTKTFFFKVYDENNQPLDLNGSTCTWKLRRLGDFGGSAVVTKEGLNTGIPDNNEFKILLTSEDTINLYGKFVQQPIVQDFAGKIYYPAQGLILIDKASL